jgi:nucleotidyltransferase substrate binding protein (TIGR01987 family)
MLNLENFTNAVNSLNIMVERYKINKDDEAARDSVIMKFQYCYGFAIKMIIRALEINYGETIDAKSMNFGDLIRTANVKKLLLGNLEDWTLYRKEKNVVVHTYINEQIELIAEVIIKKFVPEINYFLKRLIETSE